jgi:hypothetical protein
MKVSGRLWRIGACTEGVQWAHDYDDPQVAWDACRRGDWMVWYLSQCCHVDRRKLISTVWECVHKYPVLDDIIRDALQIAYSWSIGGCDEEVVRLATVSLDAVLDAEPDEPTMYTAEAVRRLLYTILRGLPVNNLYQVITSVGTARPDGSILEECAAIVRQHYPNP